VKREGRSEVGESQKNTCHFRLRNVPNWNASPTRWKGGVYHFLVIHHCLNIPALPTEFRMARGIEGNEISTPRVPKLQKSASSASQSAKQQKSILGFFQRKTAPASSPAAQNDAAPAASSPPPQSSPAPANYNGKENGVLRHNLTSLVNR
jgi:hypothetical protein